MGSGCADESIEVGRDSIGVVARRISSGEQMSRFHGLNCRRGNRRELICAGYEGHQRYRLILTETFIGDEEKELILDDRAAKVGAEIVALERGLRVRHESAGRGLDFGGIEKVARVERIVAEKVEHFAVEFVRTGARGQVDDRAGIAAVLRRERLVVNLELRESIDRRLERNLVLNRVVQIDAVDQPVRGVFAVSGRIDGKGALAAQRRGEESILWRSHGPGSQKAQVDEVPPVERNLLHGLIV